MQEVDELIRAGQSLEDTGDYEGALAHFKRALRAGGDSCRVHMNLGNVLHKLGKMDEAITANRRAVQLNPVFPPARFNLGLILFQTGDLDAAEAELLRAQSLDPAMPEAAVVLADLYEATERYFEADAQFRRALASTPNHAGTLLNYGTYCMRQGRREEALELLSRARQCGMGMQNLESFYLFSLNFATDIDAAAIAQKHRALGGEITRAAGAPFTSWSNSLALDKALRIGYVSGDFFNHPVSLFLRPVLEQHDPYIVESFCYSNYGHDNEVARVLKRSCRNWREVASLSDNELAELFRRDEIDILVDLSGHTNRTRLYAFARHPAPVQVTWLGYLNTTGLPAMDYRICDGHTDPEGATEHLHTERLVRMPNSQWCYAPWLGMEAIPITPRQPRASVVFGSFNQVAKISDACLASWCRILSRVRDSSLLVLDVRQPDIGKHLLSRIERNGVDIRRVELRGRQSMVDYFTAINSVDIALDTYPYNGATTTFDALWMGTPLVALRGDRGISRGSYSILKSLGAEELITSSAGEYVELNVRLAADVPWRLALHGSLRPRLRASPLMEAEAFTRALERHYREMWRAWCLNRNKV